MIPKSRSRKPGPRRISLPEFPKQMQFVKVRCAFLRPQIPYVLWVDIARVMFVAVTIYRVAKRIGGEQAKPLGESPLQLGYHGVIGRVDERRVVGDIADALVGTPRI